jgi:hypothetical protein
MMDFGWRMGAEFYHRAFFMERSPVKKYKAHMKKFSVPFQQNPTHLVTHLQNAARDHGMHFCGDDRSGHFRGMGIEGQYVIRDQTFRITVRKKPLLVPWSMLEAKLTEFFGQAERA